MRKPRDWEWKKMIETPDNTFQIGEMMQKEEEDEVQALYHEIPGLREYVEADHTVQDFVDNYETLGFDIGVFQYHLCRFRWNLDQLFKIKEPGEWKPISYESAKIPDKLALKIIGDVIPDKYKSWGFAIYFTDNDFGVPMEVVGKLIGERYREDFFDIAKGICEFEENYVIAEEYCNMHLGKYFDEEKLKVLIDKLFPTGEILSSWSFLDRELPTDEHIDYIRGYLEIPKRKIKIGSEEEVISWLVENFGEPENKDWKYPWCNAEVLLVQFSPDKVEVKVI